MTDPAPAVFVIDDDSAVRKALGRLLRAAGFRTTAFASAEEFLARLHPDAPACVVLDVRMPGMSGLDLQAELAARRIEIPVLIVTGYAEVALAVRAMKGGAFDFIEKPFSDQALLDRIRAAVALDEESRRHRAARQEVAARLRLLTARERDVLTRVVTGKSNKVIAAELQLSTKTVEVHRSHVMEKLKADSLADLIRLSLLATEDDASGPPRT